MVKRIAGTRQWTLVALHSANKSIATRALLRAMHSLTHSRYSYKMIVQQEHRQLSGYVSLFIYLLTTYLMCRFRHWVWQITPFFLKLLVYIARPLSVCFFFYIVISMSLAVLQCHSQGWHLHCSTSARIKEHRNKTKQTKLQNSIWEKSL